MGKRFYQQIAWGFQGSRDVLALKGFGAFVSSLGFWVFRALVAQGPGNSRSLNNFVAIFWSPSAVIVGFALTPYSNNKGPSTMGRGCSGEGILQLLGSGFG